MISPRVQQFADYQNHPTLYMALDAISTDTCPHSYLEIGTREGCSTQTVVEASPHLERLVMCDTWQHDLGGSGRGNHNHIDQLLDKLEYRGVRIYFDGDSLAFLPNLNDTFDLVLIDGDHHDAHAEADAREGWRLLRPGGTLLFDDILHPEYTLRPVFERLFDEFQAEPYPGIARDVGAMRKPWAASAR